MRKALALLGVAASLIVYIAAFSVNASIEVCISHPIIPPSMLAGGGPVVASPANFQKAWVVLVASRCELTYPSTGTRASTLVIEWGPSALAIAGLIGAASSLWIWFRFRSRED